MISGFPDISSNTILQNCFHPFLSAVLHGFGPATLFPCIHVPSPSVPTLAWCRARSISPFQGLRGRGDGGKPLFSIQRPSSLSQESTRAGHGAARPVQDEGICRAGGEGQREEAQEAAEVLKTGWRKGRLFHCNLRLESKFPRSKTWLPAIGDELSERRNPDYNLLHSPLSL